MGLQTWIGIEQDNYDDDDNDNDDGDDDDDDDDDDDTRTEGVQPSKRTFWTMLVYSC